MQRCNWCNNPINNSPFSNYCSKKCEKEAVSNGERKGYKSSTSAVFLIIFIIMIGYYAIKKNSSKSQETKENVVEQNYSTPTENRDVTNYQTNQENNVSGEETNSQNEITQENSSDTTKVQASEEQIQTESNKDEIVIRLLNEGRSVKEVAEATGLTKKEVRQIRRNAE